VSDLGALVGLAIWQVLQWTALAFASPA